jgi:hypothetical protein
MFLGKVYKISISSCFFFLIIQYISSNIYILRQRILLVGFIFANEERPFCKDLNIYDTNQSKAVTSQASILQENSLTENEMKNTYLYYMFHY